MKTILLLENDLMFGVRLEKGFQKLGYEVVTIGTEAQLAASLSEDAPALAVLNFAGKTPAPLDATARLHHAFPEIPLLGYYSHTKIPEIRSEAKAAGLTLLVPNSAIATRLPQLIARLLPEDETGRNLPPDVLGASQIAEEAE